MGRDRFFRDFLGLTETDGKEEERPGRKYGLVNAHTSPHPSRKRAVGARQRKLGILAAESFNRRTSEADANWASDVATNIDRPSSRLDDPGFKKRNTFIKRGMYLPGAGGKLLDGVFIQPDLAVQPKGK